MVHMRLKDHRLLFRPDEIMVIDTERKMLPFREASIIKRTKTITSYTQYLQLMNDLSSNNLSESAKKYLEPVKLIFVDSFTRLLWLMGEHYDKKGIKGFDYWREMLIETQRRLMTLPEGGRFMVFNSLDDVVQDADGINRIKAFAQGQMSGQVESFFTIVLHTHYNRMKKPDEAYQFCTNGDGLNTAKTPIGMFEEKYIPNDLGLVLGTIYEYYDMANNKTFSPKPILIVGKSGSGKSTSLYFAIDKEVQS